jgi:hypothetical protein
MSTTNDQRRKRAARAAKTNPVLAARRLAKAEKDLTWRESEAARLRAAADAAPDDLRAREAARKAGTAVGWARREVSNATYYVNGGQPTF